MEIKLQNLEDVKIVTDLNYDFYALIKNKYVYVHF